MDWEAIADLFSEAMAMPIGKLSETNILCVGNTS